MVARTDMDGLDFGFAAGFAPFDRAAMPGFGRDIMVASGLIGISGRWQSLIDRLFVQIGSQHLVFNFWARPVADQLIRQ